MPNINVKDSGTWKPLKAYYVKDAGTWKTIKVAYVKDGGVWKQYWPPFIIGANQVVFATSGSFTWTVPIGCYSVSLNVIGGGGNCSGYFDNAATIYVSPGGPGGGVQNLVLSVNPGDTISGTVGYGGGGVSPGVLVGSPGAPTDVYYNGSTHVCNCQAGGQSTYLGAGGAPGSATIYTGSGTVVTGTAAIEYATTYGQCGWGYDIWPLISCGTVGINYAGVPPIIAPVAAGSNYNELGRAERNGWVSITY